ncbi:MAG: hypothetical protein SVP26_00675 [Chloroflexota bacterium]|nr:hypothetical protein [Chloroflexota bacterium]
MTAVLIILPIMLVMRTRPEDMGLLPDGVDRVEADAGRGADGDEG